MHDDRNDAHVCEGSRLQYLAFLYQLADQYPTLQRVYTANTPLWCRHVEYDDSLHVEELMLLTSGAFIILFCAFHIEHTPPNDEVRRSTCQPPATLLITTRRLRAGVSQDHPRALGVVTNRLPPDWRSFG